MMWVTIITKLIHKICIVLVKHVFYMSNLGCKRKHSKIQCTSCMQNSVHGLPVAMVLHQKDPLSLIYGNFMNG